MEDLSIIVAPDPRLKKRAEPVDRVDRAIQKLMDAMLETMRRANGIGLAAPQVGVLKRVIVVDTAGTDQSPTPYQMANPEILWRSEETLLGEEGCLSLPEHFAEVSRPVRIGVVYLDREGRSHELEAEGLLARCIQHEVDHLNGVLFVDHLSALRRSIILRKLTKARKLAAVS